MCLIHKSYVVYCRETNLKLWAEIEQACDPDPTNEKINGFEEEDSPFVISHACSQHGITNIKSPIVKKLNIHAPTFSIGKHFSDSAYTNNVLTAMHDFFDSRLQWKKAFDCSLVLFAAGSFLNSCCIVIESV